MSDPTEQPTAAAPQLEAEEFDDNDSALGTIDDERSSTTSLNSSILQHRKENGRTYHSYAKELEYVLPNDELESDRLDLQHHLYYLTLDNRLYLSKPEVLNRVLDIGTGTGIWALDFADEHPQSQIIGVDLSPIQPDFVAPNVVFQIDDVEREWTYSHKFDFIHSRMMTGGIADWPRLFKQAFDNLNPGGYMEVSDIAFPARSDDGTLPEDSALSKYCKFGLEAAAKLGRPANSAEKYVEQLEAAGFTDVVKYDFKWPQNRWPKDPKFKEMGAWTFANIADGLEGLSLGLFTRGLGWSVEELQVFLVDVRKDLRNTRIHAYWPITVVSARKPLSAA